MTVIRTHNINAGVRPPEETMRILRPTLDWADLVLGQELAEVTDRLEGLKRWDAWVADENLRQRELAILARKSTIEVESYGARKVNDKRWGWYLAALCRDRATGDRFWVVNVHMPIKANVRHPRLLGYYKQTVRALVAEFGTARLPVVIGGDWNQEATTRLLAPLREAGFHLHPCGPTHGFGTGRPKGIDYFAVKGATVTESRVLPRVAGDHAPASITITIP